MEYDQYLIPTVIEKTQYGERAYDIYSRLLKERIIFIGGPINDAVANSIIAQMLFTGTRRPKERYHALLEHAGRRCFGRSGDLRHDATH